MKHHTCQIHNMRSTPPLLKGQEFRERDDASELLAGHSGAVNSRVCVDEYYHSLSQVLRNN